MKNPPEQRLPSGQQLVAAGKWPIVGEREPANSTAEWTVEMVGRVDHPQSWSLEELRGLPQDSVTVDIHCVTRWSKLQTNFTGVMLKTLLQKAGVQAEARFVSFVAASDRQHSTSLPLQDAIDLGVFIALTHEGRPLPTEHGGPVRVITPSQYFYKSLKWLRRIELLNEDRLGYWEAEAGYHNVADPWREQRYIAPNISKQLAARLIESRDFTGQELRGIDLRNRDLKGLTANDALLRDADFRDCDLAGANFDRANLSNAHFQNSNLHGTSFIRADCEGANFAGADLCGADFTDASLLAATFSPNAKIDETTRISEDQLQTLMPVEAEYLQAVLRS